MDAHVVLVNIAEKRFAARLRGGAYTICEVKEGPMPEVGDVLAAAFSEIGTKSMVNLTKKKMVKIRVTHPEQWIAMRVKQKVKG